MFKPRLLLQEQGFTLVEVLVAILIATMFVAVAMQMMAIAAVFKARAQEFAEATTWIQQDLEEVKYNAELLQYTFLVDNNNGNGDPTKHGPTDTVLYVNSTYGFQVGDTLRVGTDLTNNTIQGIAPANKTITLATKLDTTQLKGQIVVAINTIKCTAVSKNVGFADRLRDMLTDPTGGTDLNTDTNTDGITKTSSFTNKVFTLRRTVTISGLADASPYNLLKISYDVISPSSGNSSIANLYTELIPNAALQCP